MPTPLANAAELVARLGRPLTDAEAAKAPGALLDASSLIRAFTRRPFEAGTNVTQILRANGMRIRLPRRPVTAVDAVAVVGCGGDPDTPLTGWCWDGIDLIHLDSASATADIVDRWWVAESFRVTYDYDGSTIADVIVTLACSMVIRAITSPSEAEGMVGERVGQYGYQATGTPGVAVRLTADDENVLVKAGYRRRSTSVSVSLG